MTYDPRRILEELLEEKAEIQAAITFFAVKAGVIEGAELTPEDLELAQREVRRFAETEVGVSGAAAILGREGGKKGGRARAEARDAVEQRISQPVDPHGKNAGNRARAPVQVDVRGRKTELFAELNTTDNTSRHSIIPAQQTFCALEIAGRQKFADSRTRYPVAVFDNTRYLLD